MHAWLQHLVLRDTYPLLFCLKPQNDGPLLEQTLASTLFPPEHHLHKRTHNSTNWNDWRTRTRVIFSEHLRQVSSAECMPTKNPLFECHFLLFESYWESSPWWTHHSLLTIISFKKFFHKHSQHYAWFSILISM